MSMDNGKNKITERIIKLTLKILYLLFEEDYIIMKKSGDQLKVSSHSNGLQGCSQSLDMESPSEKENYNKILEIINKITKLLTGEVPIRYQDVTVNFSLEEWEYLNRHNDLYRHMMEDQQPFSSPDPRSSDSTCQSPMSSQYGVDEDYDIVITATNYTLVEDQIIDLAKMSTLYEGGYFSHFEKHMDTNSIDGISRNIKNSALCMRKLSSPHRDHTYALTDAKARALLHKLGYRPPLKVYSSSGDTQDSVGDKKVPLLHEEHHLQSDISSHVDSMEYTTVRIKDDPYICKVEEQLPYADSSTDECNLHTSTPIKQETDPCQEFPSYPSTYTVITPLQYNSVHIKEEPMSGEEEVPAEIELYVDGTHCPSDFPKKPKKSINLKDRPLSCIECGKHFKRKSGLGRHKKIHATAERYTCHDCGKCFLSLMNLEEHQKIHTEDKPYSCDECGKRFSKATNLSNHQKIHATKNPFSCAKCGKQFASNSNLRRHQKKHEGKMETTEFAHSEGSEKIINKCKQHPHPTIDKPYQCTECGRCFIKRINLLNHQRLHTRMNLHYCQECGKYFMSRAYLLRHMKGHSKKRRPCSCPLCGKYFHNKLGLTIHQRIHIGERPSTTSEWRKSFIRKLGFVIQERNNVGEKPCTCSECGERFEKKLQLLRHQKTHKEEKPFPGCVAVKIEHTEKEDVDVKPNILNIVK